MRKTDRVCRNRECRWHSGGKCTLFPGGAWLTCLRSGGKPATKKQKKGQ